MSYCPECGEQIAKEDVFCPYCGISVKPIVPVHDASMSETIANLPPEVMKQVMAETSGAKTDEETPKAETPNKPSAAEKEVSGAVGETPQADNPPSENTAENWTMKTDSIEVSAGQLKDVNIPSPDVLGDDKPKASDENAPVFNQPPPSPFSVEEQNLSSSETPKEPANYADAPMPSIIQNEEAQPEFKPEASGAANKEEEYFPPLPTESEMIELTDSTPIADEPVKMKDVEPVYNISANNEDSAEKWKEIDEVPAQSPSDFAELEPEAKVSAVDENSSEKWEELDEIPANFDDRKVKTEVSEPPMQESEILEIDKSFAASEKTAPATQAESLTEETENSQPQKDFTASSDKTFEPPIAMPDSSLALEDQDEPSRFDSVQIIQKNEIEEEKSVSAPFEPAIVEKTEEPKEERSFTTPNIANGDTDGRKAAKLKPLDEGTILNNRYEIVRKIGGGGMGAVYLANDRNLGGVLRAVKEMVQSYIESEQQDKAIADFKRESLLLTSLDHTAIPTIFDYFFDEKEGRFYLVMKYISGGDLAGRLRAAPEGRLDEKSVTEWAIQIADVLDYLHNHEPSIVYRDLKPANVMIDGNSGRVMLIDFGIARWVNKEEKGVTAVGTMGYAPPELFSGNVEPRSDIYSLGSTMFHLLTGADPQSNPLLIFDFQKNPRPRQINSQLSDQIEQILMRSVEYNADARFSSAAELRDALKEHYNNLQANKVTFGVKVAPSNRAFSEQSVFCGFCGKQIVATDVFCAFCGAQQPIAQHSLSSPSLAVQPLTAKLVIMGTGELEPSSFRLEKSENLLGRRDPMSNIFPEVDLSKFDPQTKISRRHARIWREGNSFLVEDLGSSNGTTLLAAASDAMRLLPHQPHTLTNGDKIKVGDTTLHFTIG